MKAGVPEELKTIFKDALPSEKTANQEAHY